MVKLQKASGRNRNGAWQRIWDSLTGNPGRMPAGRKPRRLMIDQLEERQLLSVSPASLKDVLVNQVASYSDTALSAKSVAADNNGDFVVTWSRTDYTTSGQSDENVYARYYTDAVQRIDLPTGATSFMLQYNGNAIDTLSVSAGTAPFQSSQNPIKVAIKLKFGSTNISTINYDETKTLEQNAAEIQTRLQAAAGVVPELNGVIVQATDAHNFIIKYGPASNGHESALTVSSVDYDPAVAVADRCFLPAAEITNARIPGMTMSIPISTTNPSVTADNIAYALKYGTTQTEYIAPIVFPDPARIDPVLGSPAGPYNSPLLASTTAPNVKVSAVSATKFEITFIGDTGKLQQPLMTVLNASSTPGNPILLVGASSEIIKQTSNEFRVNDTEVDDPGTLTYDAYDQSNAQVAMDSDGDFVITWQSEVPNSQDYGSVSDIYARTFTPSGYVVQRQDIQIFSQDNTHLDGVHDVLQTDKGQFAFTFNGSDDSKLSATALLLQTKLIDQGYDPDTTRVTAERTGPTTYVLHVQFGGTDVGNVISDIQKTQADSVIKITSVDDATTSFLADMNVDGTAETGIQNVRATKNQFMVNTTTVNAQSNPSVGVDGKGNFTIAWQSQGQNLSFFNQIKAQRYDFNGNPLGYEFAVSTENTSVNFSPYVAVSDDGAIAVGWCNSNDPNQYLNGVTGVGTRAKVFGTQGQVLLNEFAGPGAGVDAIAFDSKDNFVITGSSLTSNDNFAQNEGDVFAEEWELYDANGNVSGAVLRPAFRVNSASFDTATNDFWPGDQYNSQPAMDADGDLVISYQGYGPDVSEYVYSSSVITSALMARINSTTNSDLLPYFNPATDSLTVYGVGDVDVTINNLLIHAASKTPKATAEQLGRLRSILENVIGTLRGEANGAMFSQFDADPHANQAPSTILTSDNIANNQRDGSNQTYLFALDRNAVSGGFTLRLYTQNVAGYVDVDITPVYYENNGPVDPYETLKAIHNALSGSGIVGINWPETPGYDGPFDGPIGVRLLSTQEITQRMGTAWDPTQYNSSFNISGHVYEITFQGELHDSFASLYLQKNDMKLSADPTAEVQRLVFSQTGATTPTGSFTFTIGGFTSTPIGFNTGNMNAVAANIESQLQAAHPGATVFFNTAYSGSGGSPWVFDITFGGATDIGIDQPRMYISLDSTLAPSVSAPPSIELIKGHAEEADAIVPQLMVQTYYDWGTYQESASIAMSSDGDFVVIWNQGDPSDYYSTLSNVYLNNLYYRTFQESTDTAGPTVANAFSSSGSILDQNTQVNVDNGLQHVVLSFDEEMQNTAETQTLTFAPTASNGTSITSSISGNSLDKTLHVASIAGFPSSGQFKIKVDNEVMLVTAGAGTTTWTVTRGVDGTGVALHNSGAKVQSSFLLKIGDLTSAPLWYNSVDPSTMVGSLQTAIETLAGGLGGVSVSYNKNTSKFQVTFGGNYRGLYVPLMQTVMDPAVTFKGTITPALQYDSVTNPMNYRLLLGNAEVPGSVINVEYGLNKASELAALAISDPANYGQYADLSILPTNKWEAIITIDGNGTLAGTPLLASGTYTIQALTPIAPTTVNPAGVSGLRDLAGNPLGYTGYEPNGVNYSQQFELVVGSQSDTHTDPNPSAFGSNGYTSQESPGAVAVDADGDHIVTWTAYDSTAKCDRVYFQKYYKDGTHSDIMAVTAGSFAGDAQGYATVACDADGDFVITWTNYRDENGDAALDFNGDGYVDGQPGVEVREQVDVYAQRFTTSNGSIQKVGSAFRVNTYTTNDQLWSNVAMNAEGAFVITWSSMGQEDNGQNGSGYGIYARRYDSFGQPIGPEFQVNVTTAGNQQNSSVAMAADGGFVVVWQSAQNGVQSDIVARSFNADGTPQQGPLYGEQIVNVTTAGNQRYPDVSMNLDGTKYVVTWQSSGQDGSGWGVFSREFNRVAQASQPVTHSISADIPPGGLRIPDVVDDFQSTITVTSANNFLIIQDLSVHLDITDPTPRDLTVWLTSPNGTDVVLFSHVPRAMKNGTIPGGANFNGTVFNDAALVKIDDSDAGAVPPFASIYSPEQALAGFDSENAVGVWTLHIKDDNLNGTPTAPEDQFLNSWSLDIVEAPSGGPEVAVNTTITGDQLYPSVAMFYDGSYVVTWSGYGTQTNQADTMGVYYQRYSSSGMAVGSETRANISTTGNQWISSVGADATGNFVIAWTGTGSGLGETDVYRYVSANALPMTDHTGAIITDVVLNDGTRVQDGDTVQPAAPGITQMIVVFSENMYTGKMSDGSPGLHSILNLQNWSLYLNGTDVTNAISNISFGLNTLTKKYEANLTFSRALAAGNYTLVAHDNIWDAAQNYSPAMGTYIGNYLDGDFDGVAGTNSAFSSQPGYSINFTAAATPRVGAEVRVNNTTANYQVLSSTESGTGTATQQSIRTVAMDHSGDFAVVWTSYGQDDPSDPYGTGVYMQLIDRNNNVLTPTDVLVNTRTAGNQFDGTVAMDADGDFVVVWQSDKQDPDGSAGIYAQRFNSMGQKIGSEFRVNTNYTNNQAKPAVAMDSHGNFVVVWASVGQSYSYFNDIRGQIFDRDGNRVGNEFVVNSQNMPGTVVPGGNEVNPSVAFSDVGTIVVSWDQNVVQVDGVTTDSYIMARMFNSVGTPIAINGSNTEFRVNVSDDGFISDTTHNPKESTTSSSGTITRKSARNSQIAMDQQGNFSITWEAFQDNDIDDVSGPDSYGIYFRRFSADGTPQMSVDHQANIVITDNRDQEGRAAGTVAQNAPYERFAGAQVNPSIAMDADGDYVIAWDGNGAQPHPLDIANGQLQSDMDSQGVWIRNFHAGDQRNIQLTDEAVTVESRVNVTSGGGQEFPSVAMTPDGDVIVVWSGNGVGDRNGIFYRRYKESTDTAGPELTDFLLPDGTPINSNEQVGQALSAIVVTFDEAMLDNLTHSGNAVTNPANFKLLKDGVEVVGGITQVFYGLNMANTLNGQYGITSAKTNKYEAVLIVDDNGAGSGILPLADGHYQLVAKNSLRDAAGNPLHSTGVNPNGDVMSQTFNVTVSNGQETQVANSTNGGKQTTSQSVAGDADGDHVVVWTNTNAGQQGVYFKIYNVFWTVDAATNIRTASYTDLGERLVTNDVTATEASVARDADGDFVVTWTAQNGANGTDIFAQLFDATGNAKGVIFRVNTYTVSAQSAPAVAMGTEGDFVITWQSLGQDKSGYGIYAQRFSRDGERLGGTNEIQTLNIVDSWTGNFSLLWDDDNNAATADRVTSLINYSGNMAATSAAVKKALADIGANVEVMVSGTRLSIIFTGNSASINQSLLRINPADLVKTGGLTSSARIEISTVQDGDPGEFRVNDTTVADQTDPSISMDKNGNFVISWTSSVQDAQNNWNTDVYAKKFATSGSYWNGNSVQVNSNPSANSSLPSNASIEPMISTVDDPTNHLVSAGTGFDGVVQVNFDVLGLYMGYGSGVLLAGSNVILTAAHVATFQGTSIPLDTQFVNVTFDTPTGPVTMGVSQIIVNPGFTGFLADGNDIAMIVLDGNAPTGVTGYDIYRGSDEVGQVGSMYGYGITGTGAQGETGDSNNEKYSGQNRIDSTSSIFGAGFSNTFLMSDFDSGLPANDAMGIYYNVHDLGLGVNEAALCSGDSGGPMLINGKIAGIASFGMTLGGSQDSVPGLNSSFGEFFGETRVSTFASWIDSITAFSGGEFRVNADDILQTDPLGNPTSTINNTSGDQKWSSVGMDDNGDFVITWTSAGHDGSGNGYGASAEGENGVFARRYNAHSTQIDTNHDGVLDAVTYAASNAFQINDTTGGDQQHATVAMDADGDFTVAWESSQSGNLDVYAKRYIRTSLVQYAANTAGALVGTNPLYGTNGEIGAEFSVNSTKTGNQSTPSITMDEAGDFVVVWNGAGKFDTQGIYLQRFNRPTDDAGPIVADALAIQGSTLTPVAENSTLDNATSKFVITFGENVSTVGGASGANSILNPSNWVLLLNGQVVPEAVSNVEYGLSQANASGLMASADGKYEAVVTFKQALGQGSYVLTLKESVQDLSQNNLDGNFDGTKGGSFALSFTIISSSEGTSVVTSPGTLSNSTDQDHLVNTIETGEQITPAVAADAHGNYVVVWATDQTDSGDIMAQRYDRYGRTIGRAFLVSSFGATRDFVLQSSTSPGFQTEPVVAMDSYGNFVVVWAGTGANDDYGIYARVFDVNGAALGDEFLVNEHTANVQNAPSVAMDADGDFVVSWTSYGQDGDRDGVYAKRFNILGQAQTNELQVNTTGVNRQQNSDVAMDVNGNFVVTWESDSQDGSSTGIYAQRFNAGGTKLGGEFLVNQNTSDKQDNAKVAMDSAGNFVVTWSSFGQDGSGYGIYARRYNQAGTPLSNEFLVNQTTLNWQVTPDVGMDAAGNFVITWSSQRDSNVVSGAFDYGIYARMYNADGSDFVSTTSGQTLREWRVNAQTAYNQMDPAVGVAQNGQFTIVWTSPDNLTTPITGLDTFSTGVYSRVVSPKNSSPLLLVPSASTIGLLSPNSSKFYLKNSNTAGNADTSFAYGPAGGGWISISGDWDGDGIDTIGLYSPVSGTFYLKNNNAGGYADIAFVYGPGGAGWTPIVGDWDGNGIDTIGLYNSNNSTFYLRNTNDAGAANITSQYGPAGAGWKPVAGDWDGNGTDTIGLYSPASGKFFLRNTNNTGIADITFVYGPAGSNWAPLAGDWDADGRDTIGMYSPASSKFYLRNTNTAGVADNAVSYGPAGGNWIPIVGTWTRSQALVAADGATTADADVTTLTQTELQPIVHEAISRWAAAGLDDVSVEKLKQAQFTIGDLSGAYLGTTQADQIYLDSDAAGHGWFVDSTPASDEEYSISTGGASLAIDPRAVDRIDLLSVVEHELGHIAGLDDLGAITDNLMSGVIEAGVRRAAFGKI